ncbi:DUF2460 domain-containing protein [Macromonas nakdongensis]|uniref:DUF2460 domain-containing protein n=1 Tax=Macromonas nakdongensis TaxID=1843082 RepID=UPI000C34345C|nr:DUF2460 domain-containing protein [Macromonas nakdongensis]
MAFFEHRFPERISREAVCGPRFANGKAYMPGGQRQTNRMAAYPLQQYTIDQPLRSAAEFEQLRAFFYVVGGDADAFRFKDWSDYRASLDNTSTTLVTGTTYQLNRIYPMGVRTFVRPIYKPNTGLRVYRTRSGATTDITDTCAVDTTTGRVTVNTGHASGDVYRWVGTFDVPVAFKDPSAAWRLRGGPRMLMEWTNIELEEVRL